MNSVLLPVVLLTTLTSALVSAGTECVAREFGKGNIVCVCNSTYCDTVDRPGAIPAGQYVRVSTSKAGLRFLQSTGTIDSSSATRGVRFKVDTSKTYQTIHGFGGAFTDAAGINIKSLSPEAEDKLLRAYFSPGGIEFNCGRVPIAGCDFSTHTYTYDDVANDTSLSHFNLTQEDDLYKIPLIKRARELSEKKLLLFGAAWTAPPWMKTNNDYSGFGFLLDEYYQLWADYLIKFLDAYKEEDLEFWAISTGNEPANGIIPINRFNSMGWTPQTQRQWIAENLGPALRSSQHSQVKLLAIDDQRFMLPWWMNIMMEDERVAGYIDGVAVHWYWDTMVPASILDHTHNNFPEKFLIATEACVGDKPWDFEKVKLGSWSRGASYMKDIIQDMNHWVTGWIDWNLALDPQGGPNWAKNFVDAAVIVNSTSDEFYKQPMFYALGHFSKFVPPGSIRVDVTPQILFGVEVVAFRTPEESIVVVVHNRWSLNAQVTITDLKKGNIHLSIPRYSFHTIIY